MRGRVGEDRARWGFFVVALLLSSPSGRDAVGAEQQRRGDRLPNLAKAAWVWAPAAKDGAEGAVCYSRTTFQLKGQPSRATVLITADNGYELNVNGSLVGSDGGYDSIFWKSVERYEVAHLLREGRNVLALKGVNGGGAAGVVLAARIELAGGATLELRTGGDWRTSTVEEASWAAAEHDDAGWPRARVLGAMGIAPWGDVRYTPGTRRGGGEAQGLMRTAGDGFSWPEGIVFLRGRVQPTSTPAPQSTWPMHGSRAFLEHDGLAPAALGRQLYSLVPAKPDGRLTLLCDAGMGVVGTPRVSYDGKTIYFSMAGEGEKFFHIYRIGADGRGLTPLTDGPFHDYDPEPLPDGGVVFSSTRIGSREEYHGNLASSLFILSADGKTVRPLTHHIVADREPRVMPDGTIVFVRSDNFLERAKVETQIHQVRPDGSGGQVILGANRGAIPYDRSRAAEQDARWLRSYGYGSPAPLPDGRVAAISHRGVVVSGRHDEGQLIEMPFVPFDVAALPDGRLLCTSPRLDGFGVYDFSAGEVTRLYAAASRDAHSVAYLGPRPRPVVGASGSPGRQAEADASTPTGYLLCQNVFNTRQTHADLSRIRAVRVFEGRPMALRTARHPYAHLGVEAVELGTVPLAPDGSFYVRVPADRALAMQAVDAEGRAVINELSWVYARPNELRSCVGCHNPREGSPPPAGRMLAARAGAVSLLGVGQPHRFRGNNAANGGVLNLQLDRFREAANVNLFAPPPPDQGDAPLGPGRALEVARLVALLKGTDVGAKVSSAQRLGVIRERAAAPAMAAALKDGSAEVRLAAALALASCGDRGSVPALLDALEDSHSLVAQAAHHALEHFTGHAEPFDPFAEAPGRNRSAGWRRWFGWNSWEEVERGLVARLGGDEPMIVHRTAEALGHVGRDRARAALREYVAKHPDGELRVLMVCLRSLGHLRDADAVPMLAELLSKGRKPVTTGGFHETGFVQKPVYLAATSAEALGWIGTPAAEAALLAAVPRLGEFWYFSHQTGDHEWLMGSHGSVVHYRILEALDAIGTTGESLRRIVPDLLRSVPIDSDRGILLENDGYETLVCRVVQRSGLAPAVVETCLHVLGDQSARVAEVLRDTVTASPPAVSTGVLDPASRAAHLLSVVCYDGRWSARTVDALSRYRARPQSRTRSWVCFMLARALGKMGDRSAAPALIAALSSDTKEAQLGLEDPPHTFVHKGMTPFHRAAAADALGRLGARDAAPVLMPVVGDLDNAVDVRHSAARALAALCKAEHLPQLKELARDYPEVATRRVLLRACEAIEAANRGK